jgi:hypothetical protein
LNYKQRCHLLIARVGINRYIEIWILNVCYRDQQVGEKGVAAWLARTILKKMGDVALPPGQSRTFPNQKVEVISRWIASCRSGKSGKGGYK